MPLRQAILIGLGEVALGMLPFLRRLPGFAVVAGVDPRLEAHDQLEQQLGSPVRRFPSWEAALADPGSARLAIINTPGDLHVEPVRAALETGLDVLVAKPFAPTLAEARGLVEAAERLGRKLAVAQQMRFMAHLRQLRSALAAGMIGRPEIISLASAKPRPQPRNLTRDPQPTLREMGCHHFDNLLSLIPPDARPRSLWMRGFRPSWSPYAGPCTLHGTLEFSPPTQVIYQAGYSARGSFYELRLEGEGGALRYRALHMSVEDGVCERAEPGGAWQRIDLPAEAASPWTILLTQWWDWLDGGPEPCFSGRNNLAVMRLLEAAQRSMETGQPVNF